MVANRDHPRGLVVRPVEAEVSVEALIYMSPEQIGASSPPDKKISNWVWAIPAATVLFVAASLIPVKDDITRRAYVVGRTHITASEGKISGASYDVTKTLEGDPISSSSFAVQSPEEVRKLRYGMVIEHRFTRRESLVGLAMNSILGRETAIGEWFPSMTEHVYENEQAYRESINSQ
jgi:hypothetical protein